MKIEVFKVQDVEGVQELILNIQVNEFGLAITKDAQPDLIDIERFYVSGGGNFWIAKTDGAVVGTVALIKLKDRVFSLRKMFVHTSCRGRNIGLAGELLKTAEDWAESQGVRKDCIRNYSKIFGSAQILLT